MKKVWYEVDREQAKIGLSEETLAYIAALEQVADVAWEMHKVIGLPRERQKGPADNLYDALAVVNFLVIEEEE